MTIHNFIQYISHEKRYSEHTVKAYENDLNAFARFLEEVYNISDLTQSGYEMVRSWIVHLMDEGVSPRSVNRKISGLKSYYKYQLKEGCVANNPLQRVSTVKSSKKLPAYINQDEINGLLDLPASGEGFQSIRNKLIVELLYGTGMRRSELINLTDKSVDFERELLKVSGKRNKERIIPLSNKLLVHIRAYMLIREKTFDKPAPYIIVTDKGDKAYPNFILRKVKQELSSIKSTKKNPHILRHSFATHMLNNGADLNTIKELLGHANLSATQVYTHNTISQLKTIYNNAHPRAKLKNGGQHES